MLTSFTRPQYSILILDIRLVLEITGGVFIDKYEVGMVKAVVDDADS